MECEGKQCWCLVTASNNLQHQEKQRKFQASDVFLICADGVLLKGVRKTPHQSSCLRWFSHRFAVCCNLVRFMSHSKPWNKSGKLPLHSPLWGIGVCSAACLFHGQSCTPVMFNHFTWWKLSMWKCKSENRRFAVQRLADSAALFLPGMLQKKKMALNRHKESAHQIQISSHYLSEFKTYRKDSKSTVVLQSYMELWLLVQQS